MNVNNLAGKIASKADTIGKLYGYLAPMVNRASNLGLDPISFIITQHEQAFNALLSGKFPKIQNILTFLKHPAAKNHFKTALIAYLLGELGSGFIGNRNATALKKFATETVKMVPLSAAVITWSWNPHPPPDFETGSTTGLSESNPFARGEI
jgi:hypothetical protein